MIKFVKPGDPTPTDAVDAFTVTANIFDIASLMEGLEFAILHFDHLLTTEAPDGFKGTAFERSFEAKRQDAKANLQELKRVHDERNMLVHGRTD